MGYKRRSTAKVGKRVAAKFAGRCAATGATYEAGTEIVKTGSGWVLASHYDSNPVPTPAASPVAKKPARGVVREFEHISELFALAETPAPDWALMANSREKNAAYFRGTDMWEDAVKLARCGWHAGRCGVAESLVTISERVKRSVKTPVVYADVCGDTFDVGAAISGVPEHWHSFDTVDTERVGGSVVRLHVMAVFLCDVSTDAIMRRGAAVVALVQALEYSGYPVEVVVSAGIGRRHGSADIVYRCVIKKSSEPLELDRLGFVLSHPSFLRRYIFALMEREPLEVQRGIVDSGYGSTADTPTDTDSVFIPCMNSDGIWSSDEGATRWVLSELQRQGVELE